MTSRIAFWPLAFLLASTACIELQFLISGGGLPSNGVDGDGPPDGNDNDNANGEELEVALSVSNPTPQVNEEVFLTCEVVSGDAEGVFFDFQPASARLVIDATQGIASFIVLETDVGQAFTFTCTAENALGETATSAPRTITPNM